MKECHCGICRAYARHLAAQKPQYYHCGICEQYHAIGFNGDCRQDSARFFIEDLDALHGALGWDEVEREEALDTAPGA
jgi:hypothetical protein